MGSRVGPRKPKKPGAPMSAASDVVLLAAAFVVLVAQLRRWLARSDWLSIPSARPRPGPEEEHVNE